MRRANIQAASRSIKPTALRLSFEAEGFSVSRGLAEKACPLSLSWAVVAVRPHGGRVRGRFVCRPRSLSDAWRAEGEGGVVEVRPSAYDDVSRFPLYEGGMDGKKCLHIRLIARIIFVLSHTSIRQRSEVLKFQKFVLDFPLRREYYKFPPLDAAPPRRRGGGP